MHNFLFIFWQMWNFVCSFMACCVYSNRLPMERDRPNASRIYIHVRTTGIYRVWNLRRYPHPSILNAMCDCGTAISVFSLLVSLRLSFSEFIHLFVFFFGSWVLVFIAEANDKQSMVTLIDICINCLNSIFYGLLVCMNSHWMCSWSVLVCLVIFAETDAKCCKELNGKTMVFAHQRDAAKRPTRRALIAPVGSTGHSISERLRTKILEGSIWRMQIAFLNENR